MWKDFFYIELKIFFIRKISESVYNIEHIVFTVLQLLLLQSL